MVDSSTLIFKKQVNKYIISDKILNKTSVSTIFLSSSSTKSHLFSIKILSKDQISYKNLINLHKTQEIFSLPHVNIVKMVEILQTSENVYIIEEFCNGGSLKDYLNVNMGFLSENETLIILKELLKALKFLHENFKVFPRNWISEENVMFHENRVKISISDFAINYAGKIDKNGIFHDFDENLLANYDTWEIGVLIYKMLYGVDPKEKHGNLKENLVFFPEKPWRSEKIKGFLRKLLRKTDGISWEEVFYDGIFEENKEKEENMKEIVMKKENLLVRSFWLNKIYIEKNRVFHKIREISRNSSVFSIFKTKTEENEKNDEKIAKNRKFVGKIGGYLIFERNVAIFYLYLAVFLFSHENNEKSFQFPKDIYYRLLFLVSKCSEISMKRVFDAVMKKIAIIIEKNEKWEFFVKTPIYKVLKGVVQEDLEKIEGFCEEIEKKIREEIGNCGKNKEISMVEKNYLGFLNF